MDFSIQGKIVAEDPSHQEFIVRFFKLLKENGMHFVGVTKPLDEEVHN